MIVWVGKLKSFNVEMTGNLAYMKIQAYLMGMDGKFAMVCK